MPAAVSAVLLAAGITRLRKKWSLPATNRAAAATSGAGRSTSSSAGLRDHGLQVDRLVEPSERSSEDVRQHGGHPPQPVLDLPVERAVAQDLAQALVERAVRAIAVGREPGDILIIHTGYHRHYPENWTGLEEVDETRYCMRHPGPTRAFAEWLLERQVRWLAVDAGSADHPMNTVIRRMRPDEAEEAEAKLGRPLDELFPKADYQIMHTLLFPHDVIHIENLGGRIDEVLDQRIVFGCFPWRFQGGEAAFCRAVAFVD
jgi:kynurenine formamidase